MCQDALKACKSNAVQAHYISWCEAAHVMPRQLTPEACTACMPGCSCPHTDQAMWVASVSEEGCTLATQSHEKQQAQGMVAAHTWLAMVYAITDVRAIWPSRLNQPAPTSNPATVAARNAPKAHFDTDGRSTAQLAPPGAAAARSCHAACARSQPCWHTRQELVHGNALGVRHVRRSGRAGMQSSWQQAAVCSIPPFRALIPVIQLARAESAGPASCADLHTDTLNASDQRLAHALLSSCLSAAKLSQVLPDADPFACAVPF